MYWLKIDNTRAGSFAHIKSNKIGKSETKEFVFERTEYGKLQWTEDDKEFIYSNERYDIVSIQYSTDKVKLVCYKDNEETEITTAFNKILDRFFSPRHQSKNSENDIASKISKEYLPLKYLVCVPEISIVTSFIPAERNFVSISAIADIWHPPSIC